MIYKGMINMYRKHTYYYTCEKCHANLDPGETCDCDKQDTTEVTEKCVAPQIQKENPSNENTGSCH